VARAEIWKISSVEKRINKIVKLSVKVSIGRSRTLTFTDFASYFTPVISSFSSNRGMALDAFLARSRRTFSDVGTACLPSVSAIIGICGTSKKGVRFTDHKIRGEA
jgi:hypothetical protein